MCVAGRGGKSKSTSLGKRDELCLARRSKVFLVLKGARSAAARRGKLKFESTKMLLQFDARASTRERQATI